MRAHLLAALTVVAGATPALARAEAIQSTDAEGQAPVAGDLLAARDRAKDDALRTCVQQVAAPVVTAPTETDQAQLLSDKIYARSVRYVRRFEILEDRQDGDMWITRVRCEVSEAKLSEDLLAFGIAHRRMGLPRVLVLAAEQTIHAAQASGGPAAGNAAAPGVDEHVFEHAFVDRMERSGFGFVDAEGLRKQGKLEASGAEPGLAQARELGVASGAELVVVGRATCRPAGESRTDGGTSYSAVATVSARALRTDTGQVVATAEWKAPAGKAFEPAAAARAALVEAGRTLAREMLIRVGKAWARESSGVTHLSMTVVGVGDYGRLAAFKSALVRSAPGVKGVQERTIDEGVAELDVALAITAQAFATDLATRKFTGFTVQVRKVTASAIEVELK